MKRNIFIAIAVFLLSLMFTDLVMAAYYIDIDATESNGIDYDMLSMNVSLDIDYLADNGFIDEDGLDVMVSTSSGNPLPFMLVEDKLMFASAIEGDKTTGFQMATGNTPLDSFPVIVGDGGYVTISDHDNLELGNDFEIEFEGYIDTTIVLTLYPQIITTATSTRESLGTSHTVVLPEVIESGDLLLMFFGGDEEETITFPDGWVELDQDKGNGASTYGMAGLAYRIADGDEGASVTVTTDGQTYSAHQTFRITDYQGVPEISAGSSGNSANPNTASITPSWSGCSLYYSFFGGNDVAKSLSAYPTNYDDGQQYTQSTNGNACCASARRDAQTLSEDPAQYTMSGAIYWWGWTVAIEGAGADDFLVFKQNSFNMYISGATDITATVLGSSSKTVTASGFTSDEYKARVYADATNLKIDINDSTKDTIALAGVSANGNAADWVISSLSYYAYYTHTTSGTLRITYEPVDIISGTTLINETNPDTHDGTITFGSNPAGISIATSGLGIEESYYYTGGDTSTTDIFEPEPAELAPGLDSDKLDHNPLKPGVEGFAEASNGAFTESLAWYGIAWFSIIAVGIALIVLVREHLVFAASVSFGLSIFWYVSGVLDYWVLIIFGIFFGASLVHERMPTW